MIELDLIKTSDKVSGLRGQLNTAFNEIMTDQAMIGTPSGASAKVYSASSQIGTITAADMQETIYFDCLPESNGVFVVAVHGSMYIPRGTYIYEDYDRLEITVPAITLPTRDATISTFVSPAHLGITESATKYGVGLCAWADAAADTGGNFIHPGIVSIDAHDNTLIINARVGVTNMITQSGYLYF